MDDDLGLLEPGSAALPPDGLLQPVEGAVQRGGEQRQCGVAAWHRDPAIGGVQ